MPALSSHRLEIHRDYELGFNLTQSPGKGIVRVSDLQDWIGKAKTLPSPSYASPDVPNLRVTTLAAVQAQAPGTLLLLAVEGLDLVYHHCECKTVREGYLRSSRVLIITNRYQTALSNSENLVTLYHKLMEQANGLAQIDGRSKVPGILAEKMLIDTVANLAMFFTELSKMRWNSKDQETVKRLRLVS